MAGSKKRRYVPSSFDDFIKKEAKKNGKTETDIMLELAEKKRRKKKAAVFEWDFKV